MGKLVRRPDGRMQQCIGCSHAIVSDGPLAALLGLWITAQSADVLASMGAMQLSTRRELVQLLLDSLGVGIVSTNKNRPETHASDLLFVWCALRDSNPGPWD